MANGVARGRDEERERRTEDTRDRKIDIGTRSVRASEKGAVGARGRRQWYGEEARGRDEEGSEKLERERNI